MFGKRKGESSAINSLVGPGTRVHGDVEFKGGFLVDGYVKGNVKATDAAGATLSVTERGCIEGTVTVPSIVLNGTVKGDVRATTRVELGANARVFGNVQYKLIEMAIGAEVNGKLIHESDTRSEIGTGSGSPQTAAAQPVNAVGE